MKISYKILKRVGLFLSVLVLAISASSCKKECDVEVIDNHNGTLEHRWNLKSVDQVDGEYSQDGEIVATMVMHGSDVDGFYDFGQDGVLNTSVRYKNVMKVIDLQGDTNVMDTINLFQEFSGEYSYNPTSRYMYVYDSTYQQVLSYHVTKLTQNQLIIEHPFAQKAGPYIISSTLRLKLER